MSTSNPRKAIFKFSEAVTEPSGNIDQYYDYGGSENLFYNTAAYGSVNDAPWAIYVDNRKSWQTSEPYWEGDFTAINGSGNPTTATEWYLLAGGGETQFDSSFNVIKREAPPITKRRFAILLPTTFPHAKSGEPLKTAFIETTNSGADVPNATIVMAIKCAGIFKELAV